MNLNKITILLAGVILIASCGEKKEGLLEKKKKDLDKLKTEIAGLQAKAKVLEDEIAKLDTASAQSKLKVVEIETVNTSMFRNFIDVQGKVDAEQNTIATSKVPGVITRLLVQPGQAVRAGQTLGTIDNSVLIQNKNQLQTQLDFATTVYEKQKRLWDQKIGTEIQYLTAKNQKESLEKSMSTLQEQISMYNITSPINGVIDGVDVKIGQIAAPGMPIFRVVNLNKLKVVSDIAESYISKVHLGDAVTINFPDLKKEIKGKITFVSKNIDPLNRSFKCDVAISDPDVRPNMVSIVRITDYENAAAIAVPINAVQAGEDGNYLMLTELKNGKQIATIRKVITGLTSDGKTEIKEGLKAGESIITNGYQELVDGQEIVIKK